MHIFFKYDVINLNKYCFMFDKQYYNNVAKCSDILYYLRNKFIIPSSDSLFQTTSQNRYHEELGVVFTDF